MRLRNVLASASVRLLLLCSVALVPLLSSCTSSTPGPTPTAQLREIEVAYDPNKATLFEELVAAYNKQAEIKVRATKMEIPDMQKSLSAAGLVAVSPDSSTWLNSFDAAWQQTAGEGASIIGTTARFATTPVLIATWKGQENQLGSADKAGWGTLLAKASSDASYKWSHGSPRATASGLLAVVAEFYAGANKTYGLTKTDADLQYVRDYVSSVEKTVAKYGGESDAALVDYLLKEGQGALSALVLPEASVFDHNRRSKGASLVGIQPAEGTLMLDHPLVLLEKPSLTPDQRRAFLDFARYLQTDAAQDIVLKNGFRPVSLSKNMDSSPLKSAGISVAQPVLLQLPVPGTVEYLRDAWATGLKRRANIMLVADVSGSMDGDRLAKAKEAFVSFIGQIPSDEEVVGLAVFSSDYQEVVPLGRLGTNRQKLIDTIKGLKASGNTAWYYSLWRAHKRLADLKDTSRINVIVGMTDGKENASGTFASTNVPGIGRVPSLVGSNVSQTDPLIKAMLANGGDILVFTVGYGGDADMTTLTSISRAFSGAAYTSDPATIKKLYELISQNF